MLLRKITHGYVVQTFDTLEGKWIAQYFKAGDDVAVEDQNGLMLIDTSVIDDEYLSFDMKQPA